MGGGCERVGGWEGGWEGGWLWLSRTQLPLPPPPAGATQTRTHAEQTAQLQPPTSAPSSTHARAASGNHCAHAWGGWEGGWMGGVGGWMGGVGGWEGDAARAGREAAGTHPQRGARDQEAPPPHHHARLVPAHAHPPTHAPPHARLVPAHAHPPTHAPPHARLVPAHAHPQRAQRGADGHEAGVAWAEVELLLVPAWAHMGGAHGRGAWEGRMGGCMGGRMGGVGTLAFAHE